MNNEKEGRPEHVTKQRHGTTARRERRGPVAPSRGQSRAAGEKSAAHQARLSLGELTEAADVSVRTVRYYIAEGLLPPPVGAGPGSWYTQGHLDRLRLIQQMKDAYLPLREIRRQLAGLDDAAVQAILAEAIAEPEAAAPAAGSPDAAMAGAREYLALMETRERYRTEPMALPMPGRGEPGGEVEAGAPPARPNPEPARHVMYKRAPHRSQPRGSEAEGGGEPGLWRRIALGPEAELVISDRVYARHRDRIDWLVRWARKVFD